MGMEIVEVEGAVLGVNVGHPIVTNGDFVAKLFSAMTQLFPNYFEISCYILIYVVLTALQTVSIVTITA